MRDEFSPDELAGRLRGAEWYEDEAFTAYGLTDDSLRALRVWASAWADDIDHRIAQDPGEQDGL
jgi:hypothetical protein